MVHPFGVTCCVPACGAVTCETVRSPDACADLARSSTRCRELAGDVDSDSVQLPDWQSVVHPFIYVPFFTQLGMFLLWAILGRVYNALMRTSTVRRIVQNQIGTLENPVPRLPRFMQCMCIGQILASLLAVAVFISKCYMMATPRGAMVMDGVLGGLHAVHYFLIALKIEFRLQHLFTVWQVVDVLTVPNMILASLQADPLAQQWLTLNFLRVMPALFAYERLDKLGAMRLGMGEVAHEIVLMVFRFFTLVVVFASLVFMLEVLGELPFGSEGTLLPTAMGKISFFTMLYWVIETISTVGYGDFAPKTFLSRLTTMTFMIAGVAFFTTEANRIVSIAAKQKKGTGEYQKTGSRDHIVLLGGGVRHVDTTLILAFLDELYHPAYRMSWPDLVVMTMLSSIEKLREAVELNLDRSAQQHITYLVGSPLRLPDLRRCRCDCAQLVMIMADTTGHLDPEEEDKMNILRTLSLKTGFPKTPLRLMLLMSDSKEKALSVGIREQRCFSVNEVRSGLLWTSCRCIGWNTMFSNIVVTTDLLLDSSLLETHTENYLAGMDYEMYGFLAAEEFHEKPFVTLMSEAYVRNGVCVLAAQIDGRIVLAPIQHHGRIDGNVVFFALATSEESLNGIVLESTKVGNWKEVFQQNRFAEFKKEDERRAMSQRSEAKFRADLLAQDPAIGMNSSFVLREGTASTTCESERRPLLQESSLESAPRSNQRNSARISLTEAIEEEPVGSGTMSLANLRTSRACLFDDEDVLETKDIIEFEKRVREIVKHAEEKPFILLLDLSGSWAQVTPFILRNRTKVTPFQMPIVVLSLAPPPRSTVDGLKMKQDETLGVSIGNPVWAQDLLRSGVTECCVIVCLGLTMDPALVEAGTDATEMLDADVVLLQRMLQLLGQDTKHVILEFKRAQNMRLLPALGTENDSIKWRFRQDGNPESQKEDGWRLSRLFCKGGEKELAEDDYCLDPRFASGQIFTPHVLGAMVACEYRMPGIIEMTHRLMAPHPDSKVDSSQSFLWQIRVKQKHIRDTYGKVFLDLLHDPQNPALPLGILRKFVDDDTSNMGYVWTNPAPETPMEESDLIFVLGSQSFGAAAHKEGLLKFSGQTPSGAH